MENTNEQQPETLKRERIQELSMKHTVRHRDGGTITIDRYTKKRAIALMCSECHGFELDPNGCTDKLCPLFPYRRNTLFNKSRHTFKKNSNYLDGLEIEEEEEEEE